jgi:AraC-like DNA-binding protein
MRVSFFWEAGVVAGMRNFQNMCNLTGRRWNVENFNMHFRNQSWYPPSCEKAFFLRGLRSLVRKRSHSRVWVAGPALPAKRSKEEIYTCDPAPRLHYVISGQFRLLGAFGGCEFREICAKAGDWVLHPPYSFNRTLWGDPCYYFGAIIRPSLVRYLAVDHRSGGPTPRRITPLAFHANEGLPAPAAQVVRKLLDLAAAPGINETDPGIRSMIPDIVQVLISHLEADEESNHPAEQGYILWQKVNDYVVQNFQGNLSRNDIAGSFGVHPNHLARVCRRFGGCSYQELLGNIRLEHARYLLRSTDWTLFHIATEVGYHRGEYLNRVFRQATGMTPDEYRGVHAVNDNSRRA